MDAWDAGDVAERRVLGAKYSPSLLSIELALGLLENMLVLPLHSSAWLLIRSLCLPKQCLVPSCFPNLTILARHLCLSEQHLFQYFFPTSALYSCA